MAEKKMLKNMQTRAFSCSVKTLQTSFPSRLQKNQPSYSENYLQFYINDKRLECKKNLTDVMLKRHLQRQGHSARLLCMLQLHIIISERLIIENCIFPTSPFSTVG